MARLFSVACWNVEHFKNEPVRVSRVARFIKGENGGPDSVPDVFALFEVEGKEIFHTFMDEFPDHHFHLTEGQQNQEIFVGVHRRLQSFTTQRMEFKTGRTHQRPGLLLTIRVEGEDYPLLFLHDKSGRGTEAFGLRDAAIEHAFDLKKALDKVVRGASNLVFLGDLNTMGIDDPVPYSKRLNVTSEEEVARLADWADRRDMQVMGKETVSVDGRPKEVTWYNGSSYFKPTNLDHVVASKHLKIRGEADSSQVSLLGWPKLPSDRWDQWFSDYSDHALMYFEVWAA